jgi:hypothetical protein
MIVPKKVEFAGANTFWYFLLNCSTCSSSFTSCTMQTKIPGRGDEIKRPIVLDQPHKELFQPSWRIS